MAEYIQAVCLSVALKPPKGGEVMNRCELVYLLTVTLICLTVILVKN